MVVIGWLGGTTMYGQTPLFQLEEITFEPSGSEGPWVDRLGNPHHEPFDQWIASNIVATQGAWNNCKITKYYIFEEVQHYIHKKQTKTNLYIYIWFAVHDAGNVARWTAHRRNHLSHSLQRSVHLFNFYNAATFDVQRTAIALLALQLQLQPLSSRCAYRCVLQTQVAPIHHQVICWWKSTSSDGQFVSGCKVADGNSSAFRREP